MLLQRYGDAQRSPTSRKLNYTASVCGVSSDKQPGFFFFGRITDAIMAIGCPPLYLSDGGRSRLCGDLGGTVRVGWGGLGLAGGR